GFGRKSVVSEPPAAAMAVMQRRPARLVLTGGDDFLFGPPAPECEIWLRTGARRDGTLTALQARLVFDSGASPGAPASIAAMLLGGYYKTPHLDIESMEVLTHKPPNGAYRAPGAPQATFAVESQMNDMAQQLGLDPVEFRLRNASDTGDPMLNGRPWQKVGLRQVLQVLHDHPEWKDRVKGDGLGYGVAIGGWAGGGGAGPGWGRGAAGDLEIVDGFVRVKGTPQRALPLGDILKKSMAFGARYAPVFGNGSIPSPKLSPGFAAHLAKVRVDEETGHVQVLDYVVIQDVGFPINPAAVDGQMRGGAAQGLGWGLLEAMAYDEQGNLLHSTFADYPLPRAEDVPQTETIMVQVPSDSGPFGAKGVGEPPVIPGGAAIANAVADATGVRISSLPITPQKLLAGLRLK